MATARPHGLVGTQSHLIDKLGKTPVHVFQACELRALNGADFRFVEAGPSAATDAFQVFCCRDPLAQQRNEKAIHVYPRADTAIRFET